MLLILHKVADRSIPDDWSDLGMLEVGQGGMTREEYLHTSARCAVGGLKSPLFLGSDLRGTPSFGAGHHQRSRHSGPGLGSSRRTRVADLPRGTSSRTSGVWARPTSNRATSTTGTRSLSSSTPTATTMRCRLSLAEIFVAFGPEARLPTPGATGTSTTSRGHAACLRSRPRHR